ncbi:MAG TPA: hypothetical protein VGL93_21710 [Streptosporangiaceae bacterium]
MGVGVALALVLGGAAGATAFPVTAAWQAYGGTPAAWARSSGNDAVWMGHAWVDGRRDAGDVRRFAGRLRGSGVRDLFVHVGPLNRDGTLPSGRHPEARSFVAAAHRYLPGVRVQAWLGQRVDQGFDLTSRATRRATVGVADGLIRSGFDGIHYNFEPVSSGDPGLPVLLRETRGVLGGRPLSVSVPQLEPVAGLRLPLHLVAGRDKYWTSGYMTEVARACDQVALMAYDSVMPTAPLFGGYVADQTRRMLRAVPEGTALLIGVPAYHEATYTHDPGAETTAAGVLGVRLGLSAGGRPRTRVGVAVYADFTATARDWRAYTDGWVRPR